MTNRQSGLFSVVPDHLVYYVYQKVVVRNTISADRCVGADGARDLL